MVLVEGNQAVGSGFIATYLGKPFLFTNTHVLSGNSRIKAHTIDGKELTLQGLSVAEDYDLSIFQQADIKEGIEILKQVDSNVSIGDDVVVLGNSLGGGVVTEIRGKVTGIGPQLIETDAKFVFGNSGSPLIHLKTGKVIGIATFVTIRKMDGFGKDSKFNNIERHFAYRVDNIPAWRNTTWPAFARESAQVEACIKQTDDVWRLASDIAQHGHVQNFTEHMARGNSVARSVSDLQTALAHGQNTSYSYFVDEKRRFLFWIVNSLRKTVNATSFTQYNQKKLKENQADCDLLVKYFESLEVQLTNDPYFRSY